MIDYISAYLVVGFVVAFIRVGYFKKYDISSYSFSSDQALARSKMLYLTIVFWLPMLVWRCLKWMNQRF